MRDIFSFDTIVFVLLDNHFLRACVHKNLKRDINAIFKGRSMPFEWGRKQNIKSPTFFWMVERNPILSCEKLTIEQKHYKFLNWRLDMEIKISCCPRKNDPVTQAESERPNKNLSFSCICHHFERNFREIGYTDLVLTYSLWL